MILRPHQIYLLRMTGRSSIANGGGGGGSTSSTQATDTTSNLTNNVTSNDTRSVASDAAIALGGANDSVTQNSTTSNTANNSGNTSNAFSTSTSTAFNSASKTNSDNSYQNSGNTTSSINYTSTDFGSVQAALDGMKTTAGQAIGFSTSIAGDAIGALTHQSDNSTALIGDLFNFAKASSANSQGTAMQALGLANNTTATATAAATNDKKVLEWALAAAGVVVAFIALKK